MSAIHLFFFAYTLMPLGLLSLIVLRSSEALQLEPSRISLRSVSQSYEDTLFRRLFSSVPRRDFAVKDVSLDLESGDFLIVLGASSSGKSTILRLLQGSEQPVSGKIVVESTSTPIYLDRKPDFNNKETIEELMMKQCGNQKVAGDTFRYLCDVIDLNMSQKPSQLTPSEAYKYGLIEGCIKSVDFNAPRMHTPILILDEWMDLETSTVVHKVEETIRHLTGKAGAIVVCVTHKPNLFSASHECITMCKGGILSRGWTKEL